MRKQTSGTIFMILSALGFAIVQSLIKFLGPNLGAWLKAFYRSFFGLITLVLWMVLTQNKPRFNNIKLLVLRGVAGGLAMGFMFWAIELIELSRSVLYLYTYPVYTTLFSAIFFKEKFKPWILIPLAGAIGGIVLITDPQGFTLSLGDVVGILSGIFAGFATSSVRELRKTDKPESIYLSFSMIALLVCALVVTFKPGEGWLFSMTGNYDSWFIWLILLLIGTAATAAQLWMTTAYCCLSAATGSIISLVTVPLVVMVSIVVFNESLKLFTVLGGVLIFISTVIVIIGNKKSDEKLAD